MIERVARAMARERGLEQWHAMEDLARAAIEAMREPTPLMLDVADYAMPGVTKEASEANQRKAWELWRKMIDAALAQGGER